MNVLVTGGAGFIGSYLIKELQKRGDNIIVVDNLSTGDNTPQNVSFMNRDIRTISADEWQAIISINEIKEIYHLAAVVGVKRVLDRPLECIETNLDATKNLLEGIKESPIKTKLFISSTSEVYGKNEKRKFSETDDSVLGSSLKDRWVYASTKMLDESLCNLYARKYDIPMVIARFFSIVGAGQKSQYGMVIPNFVEQALAGDPITVYGDGTQIRSFMDVRDCVHCILTLMSVDFSEPSLVNIGNPEPIMIKELAYRIKALSGSKSEIQFIPYNKAYTEGFEEMYYRVPDISKLENILNSVEISRGLPKKEFNSLDTILQDTIQYYRNKT